MKFYCFFLKSIIAMAISLSISINALAHDFEVDGIYYNITNSTSKTVEVTSGTEEYSGSVSIPSSVTYNGTTYSVITIGAKAFDGCYGLTSITIPNSVTEIGNDAFYNCSGLTEVNISDLSAWCKIDFGSSGANPLSYTKKLKLNGAEIKDLVIPNDVTQIKDDAFCRCTWLTSVTIPNSVTTIGCWSFSECPGLTSVSIGNSVTTIGGGAFCRCPGLTTITIPNSVTTIGFCAFEFCIGLTSVTIPNSVTTIEEAAFYYCEALTSVSIGNSVRTIEDYAFDYCLRLTEVNSLNPEPPTCGGYYCFSGIPADCILKVPAGAKEAYSAAIVWNRFTNIIEIATVEVSTQDDNVTFEIPTADGAVKYTVKVYSDAEMTQLIATANYDADGKIMPMSTSLELSIDGFADGTYYYSVSALSEEGTVLDNHTGTFVINVATGIGNSSIENRTTEVARYDIHGRLLARPAQGVNIIKMSDGATRKEWIK